MHNQSDQSMQVIFLMQFCTMTYGQYAVFVPWQVKMLEALQDIEIASRLVGFDADSDDSLDEKYMKLRCDISPLPHDSEDYRLIEKYLLTTHASTHTVGLRWALDTRQAEDDFLFISWFLFHLTN